MFIRAEYKKLDQLKYISHLELMSTFRSTFRRTNIALKYSQGFNPHIIFAMSQPLPVGMIGYEEYFDLELKQRLSLKEIKTQINTKLPNGLFVNDIIEISDNEKSLQAVVNTAKYQFRIRFNKKHIDKSKIINNFIKTKDLTITRYRRNKDNRKINIASMIHTGKIIEGNIWEFTVSTGSSGNVRPQEVIRALNHYTNNIIKKLSLTDIKRLGLYVKRKDKLYKPTNSKVLKKEVK
ncbi:MAG: TIGR03936 family radical SAM-associated protein [Halanaerobiales bacterium]|nr:TIGR03936 family radical SAM-associated protein [Halanaerobiales bacterium]